jgi:hypothetical protein
MARMLSFFPLLLKPLTTPADEVSGASAAKHEVG